MPALRSRTVLACGVVLLLTGCGDESVDPGGAGGGLGGGPPEMACPPGERELDDGSCLAAGEQENGCAAGSRMVDGVCQAAGVPPDGCGAGFVHDGDAGCDVILPTAPCGPGTRAVPGDTACRGFDACGTDVYPAVPAGSTVVHVDASYAQANGDGTAAQPYRTIQEGVDAATDGAVVAIAAGSYAEDVSVVGKALTLWGRCADMVSIEAQGVAGVTLGAGAVGSIVQNLAISGDGVGARVLGVSAALEQLWIHDTSDYGVSLLRDGEPFAVSVREVLVEGATSRGVYAEGASLSVDRSVLRNPVVGAEDDTARPLNVRDSMLDQTPSQASVTSSLIEGGYGIATVVHASSADISNSLVRNVLPSAGNRFGRGISIQVDATSTAGVSLVMAQSNVENVVDGGIVAAGGQLTLEAVVVRDVAANLDQGLRGYGVAAQYNRDAGADAQLTIRDSLVERAHEAGIFATSAELTLEGVVSRNNLMVEPLPPIPPGYLPQFGGRGVAVQNDPDAPSSPGATVLGSLVEGNQEVGIVIEGITALVEGTRVRDSRPAGTHFGRGLNIQDNLGDGTPAEVVVRASVVEQSTEVAIMVQGARAVLEGVLVTDTRARPDGDLGVGVDAELRPNTGQRGYLEVVDSLITNSFAAGATAFGGDLVLRHSAIRSVGVTAFGELGDGVAIMNLPAPSIAFIDQSIIAYVARAGASSFGGHIEFSDTRIECAAVDLASESLGGLSGTFVDLGGNRCGCEGEAHSCMALSSNLTPPTQPMSP